MSLPNSGFDDVFYVANGSGGVQVLRGTSPSSYMPVASVLDQGDSDIVDIEYFSGIDDTLAAADRNHGLRLITVSNLVDVQLVESIYLPGGGLRVDRLIATDNPELYYVLLTGGRIAVVDLSG